MFRSLRSFFHFVALCLAETFRHSRSTVDLCATVLGIAIPLIQKFWPSWFASHGVKDANDLFWQVPLGVGGAVLLARLVLSPYWIYKKQADRLSLFETRRPAFRLFRGHVPRRPQIFSVEGEGNPPPVAVVDFELQFRNIGGGTAYQGQFLIHYCWLKEPSVIMSSISAVSVGDTMPGEWFSWNFTAEQRPATCMNPEKNHWWFDREGLVMMVEISYLTNWQTNEEGSDIFWLYWPPSRNFLTYAGRDMVGTVWPHVERYRREWRDAVLASQMPSLMEPLSMPDAEASWRSRASRVYREICNRFFDY